VFFIDDVKSSMRESNTAANYLDTYKDFMGGVYLWNLRLLIKNFWQYLFIEQGVFK